ncbi:complex I subunit 4 family protein [Ferribacterium limneticum]|uniref:complex I subunit 4 family protein n=1 Tax=Ferribacterium limneticum TaxID=76259 RepID=UPI001CFA2857|nr:NADH-quinone oxidoreductase subunit M [Ferribacterium limneticum]UCV29098.1 NADH-quinone oxidoreductase subunit M [Ferribacterium limneticum]UCV33016.1 NADH-quinone oxidoreductase subunit M [Ferribacterium limneticum]
MLKVLVFLPVVGAILLAMLPVRRALPLWQMAMAFALASLGYALWLAAQFEPAGAAIQMFESRAWNVRLGSYFALGVDGISLAMVLLAALLSLIAVLVSRRMEQGARLYFMLVLLLESAMFGVFTARDWSLFYVFWEATLLPLFFLIDRLGGPNRQRAALNFFLYTLGGSVFMLVALLFLYDAAPGHSFAMADMAEGGRGLPLNTQLLIFAGLFIGFGVKMPVFPLHGWLPLAHVEAPSPVSILLSGVLLKMGAYGLIRAAETLPAALLATQDWLAILAFISLLYGGILAWRQQDLKAMVAYSSISHMGVVLLGIATLNVTGLTGAVVQMVAHGLTAGTLFLIVGLLYQRTHSRDLADYGSLLGKAPRFAFFTAFGLLAAIGLPGSAGFIAELHALVGGYLRWGAWVLLLGLAMLIGAAYSLRVIGRLCLRGKTMDLPDMTRTETVCAGLLAVSILVLGLWPAPLLELIAGSVGRVAGLFEG